MVWRTASGSCFCSARLMPAVWMGGSTRTYTVPGVARLPWASNRPRAPEMATGTTGAPVLTAMRKAPALNADIVALDENAAQQLHPAVEQRNFSQLFLGEDAIGLIEAGQQQRDVIVAAVVRHKDAGAILRDVVQSLDAEPDAGDVQDAFAPMGDVLFYQLARRLGVACGQRTLGFAQHTVMDDHVPEQINE